VLGLAETLTKGSNSLKRPDYEGYRPLRKKNATGSRFEQLAETLETPRVAFCGWVRHEEVLSRLRSADVMVLRSVPANGAGAVFEALASGDLPVIPTSAGPEIWFMRNWSNKVPMTTESELVAKMVKTLNDLATNRDLLPLTTRRYVLCLRMFNVGGDGTAFHSDQRLVVRRAPKPDLRPLTVLLNQHVALSR
jgi:hypothetical protein